VKASAILGWRSVDGERPTVARVSTVFERLASGDRSAARDCLRQFGGLVWSLAVRRSPSQADAEDAVQEIFLDLWRSAPRFNPAAGTEATFVATIARRRLIDRSRRQRSRPTEPLGMDIEAPGVGAEACAEAGLAAKAVEQLGPAQRKVVLLATCDGRSHEEIARLTGLPLGTVKTYVRRGLLRVREVLLGRRTVGSGESPS
jgi:RNA polymerase sigma-70 factor, ECF subfamily